MGAPPHPSERPLQHVQVLLAGHLPGCLTWPAGVGRGCVPLLLTTDTIQSSTML